MSGLNIIIMPQPHKKEMFGKKEMSSMEKMLHVRGNLTK